MDASLDYVTRDGFWNRVLQRREREGLRPQRPTKEYFSGPAAPKPYHWAIFKIE